MAQRVDQAVVSVAAGTAKLVALTVDDDVEHLAFIPNSRLIRFTCNSSSYAINYDLHIETMYSQSQSEFLLGFRRLNRKMYLCLHTD